MRCLAAGPKDIIRDRPLSLLRNVATSPGSPTRKVFAASKRLCYDLETRFECRMNAPNSQRTKRSPGDAKSVGFSLADRWSRPGDRRRSARGRSSEASEKRMTDTNYTTEELLEALRPITSLINKSEKAIRKLKPQTWQHSLLRNRLHALRVAVELLQTRLKPQMPRK